MYKIGVTGVGGGVGQSILKSLDGTDYEVVALDGDPLAVGLYSSKKSYLIPYASNLDYIPRLLEICEKENIALLFPGLDAELKPLSINREKFEAIGTKVVVSDSSVIDISDNKQKTYDELIKFGVKVPLTTPVDDFLSDDRGFPVILKQKIGGARSKNIFLARNQNDYDKILQEITDVRDDYIVMDYIEGDEYTCGTINLGGTCKGAVIMRRVLRDGDTYKCFSVKNETIELAVRQVVNGIKPFGACNVQLRFKDGIPHVFEINARCSGTTAARTIAGFNEPKMIADYILKNIEPNYKIKELSILRYWKEFVVENECIQEFKDNQYMNKSDSYQL